jgi:putative colanic acid biosynthesis acetyltransferase WcaF
MMNLAHYDNSWYRPGRPFYIQALWHFVGLPILRSSLISSSALRRALLRAFGGKVGRGVVLKPGVRVKYPWRLAIGDHSWIGEDAWIDNLADVTIGSNACISQGAYLCTGNHDWSDPQFGLRPGAIGVGDGAWVGAHTVVCPGVTLGECAVLTAGSVVSTAVPPHDIYAGNPATHVRNRIIKTSGEGPNPAADSITLHSGLDTNTNGAGS